MSEVCFLEVAIPSRGRYTYTVNPQIFAVLLFREIRGHDKNAKILWARINFRVAAMITLGVCGGKYGNAL